MDSPNVNLKFLKGLQVHLQEDNQVNCVDLSCCGLHTDKGETAAYIVHFCLLAPSCSKRMKIMKIAPNFSKTFAASVSVGKQDSVDHVIFRAAPGIPRKLDVPKRLFFYLARFWWQRLPWCCHNLYWTVVNMRGRTKMCCCASSMLLLLAKLFVQATVA